MKIQNFENLIAWHKAQDFTERIYKIFENSKDFVIRDRICRAPVSVSNNITEDFDRSSHTDFYRFFYFFQLGHAAK